MKQINLDLNNKNQIGKISKTATEILESGGVIVYPTDTLYGLGVNAFNEGAIIKVQEIKKQDRDKPISVIVRDIKMARRITCIDSKVEKILNKIWPGPITIVLRKKDIISDVLTGNRETVAIRIPDNEFISMLMEKIDFPITATSANISGEKNLLKSTEIVEKFKNSSPCPDIFINAGNIKDPTASTIIDLTTATPKILRMGVVGKDKMQEIFDKFISN
ncbi:MAG: threonylcarbamoyl-AMP synthase [Candidatus Pacebacteria bacterium]|nr:threonylcarbamoyl-AMP synthase [Candidatus Paceibacterota bacterium]